LNTTACEQPRERKASWEKERSRFNPKTPITHEHAKENPQEETTPITSLRGQREREARRRREMPWKATAVWAYQAKEEGELSFNVGDEIIILEERRNGWWKGKRGGEIGEFPVNYCDVEGGTPPPQTKTTKGPLHIVAVRWAGGVQAPVA
jgi:hypothetical protein